MQRELARRNIEAKKIPSPSTPRIAKRKKSTPRALESSGEEEEPAQWEQFAATPIHPRSPDLEADAGDGAL
jgi:hypothetical protein